MAIAALLHTLSWQEAFATLKPLLLFVLGIVVYAVFIFKFYRFLGRKDIFKPNLQQYNQTEHPLGRAIISFILDFIEYVLLFPAFTFFWFLVLSVLLRFLAENQQVQQTFLIAMAIVASVRITAHYNEDLSRDLAKMLPFALLGIYLINLNPISLEKGWTILVSLPQYWHTLLFYLGFMVILEAVLRIAYGFLRPLSFRKNRDDGG